MYSLFDLGMYHAIIVPQSNWSQEIQSNSFVEFVVDITIVSLY